MCKNCWLNQAALRIQSLLFAINVQLEPSNFSWPDDAWLFQFRRKFSTFSESIRFSRWLCKQPAKVYTCSDAAFPCQSLSPLELVWVEALLPLPCRWWALGAAQHFSCSLEQQPCSLAIPPLLPALLAYSTADVYRLPIAQSREQSQIPTLSEIKFGLAPSPQSSCRQWWFCLASRGTKNFSSETARGGVGLWWVYAGQRAWGTSLRFWKFRGNLSKRFRSTLSWLSGSASHAAPPNKKNSAEWKEAIRKTAQTHGSRHPVLQRCGCAWLGNSLPAVETKTRPM